MTIEQSHNAFRPGCGAAFSVDTDGSEQVVVVFELEREYLRTVEPEELRARAPGRGRSSTTFTSTRWCCSRPARCHARPAARSNAGSAAPISFTASCPTSGVRPRSPTRRHGGPRGSAARRSTRTTSAPDARPATAARLIGWLREYAAERLNSRLMDERRSIAPHVMLDFGNQGVLGLQVPREQGGCGFGYVDP